MTVNRKVVLVVIDGWGISPSQINEYGVKEEQTNPIHPNLLAYDAIANAKKPFMLKHLNPNLKENKSSCVALYAHGLHVGLPDGLMGNSEVGHLNIGAGRIVYQDLVRIDKTIQDKCFHKLSTLVQLLSTCKQGNGRLHLIGLVSDGGVHSHIHHLFSLLDVAQEFGIPSPFIHFIGDGRDTNPTSTVKYLEQVQEWIQKKHYGELATLVGRYYAMDRDKRWERTEMAFKAYTLGEGDVLSTHEDIKTKIQDRYAAGETDEFLKPIILTNDGIIRDDDTLLFFNYRSDRMRQIVSAFLRTDVIFPHLTCSKSLSIASMTQYQSEFKIPVLFSPQSMSHVLAECLSLQGLRQCHIAETEKYAHVTFFFNGGREACFEGEDRILVSSPKVPTYDLMPEMSCLEVADKVVQSLKNSTYDFVMCNLAPPDMVGHTGQYEATLKAIEATDTALSSIYQGCLAHGYALLITSDHGNAEKMKDEEGHPHTAHTTAPVPLILLNAETASLSKENVPDAALCDVAPTLLDLMGLSIPKEMSGHSLLSHY